MKKIIILLLTFTLFAIASLPGTDWTFMVYLDGDNNLEGDAIDDMNEMEQVGSDSNINIVVLFDRIGGYDTSNGNWTDTRRGLVIADSDENVISSPLVSVGEKNMGDPATLTEFVNWGVSNYPADHYVLVLWNHGGGWRDTSYINLLKQNSTLLNRKSPESRELIKQQISDLNEVRLLKDDNGKPRALKDVCFDDTSNDVLYTEELRTALNGVSQNLDIIAIDACLMQMTEVAYEIKDQADIIVGSEQTVPLDGYPYNTILGDLKVDSNMTPQQLASVMVTRYGESYYGAETLSAIDLSQMNSLASNLSSFASAVVTCDSEWNAYLKSRVNAGYYTESDYRDLSGFLSQMIQEASVTDVVNNAQQALSTLNSMVIANHSASYEKANGLSIYLTNVGGSPYSTYSSSNLTFAADTQWDEMLNAAASKTIPDDSFEENDSRTAAASILKDSYTGLCCKDEDWFQFNMAAGDSINITMYHYASEGDLDMSLFDSSGVEKGYSETYSNIEYIYFQAEQAGAYYIKVYGYGGAQNFYYNLHVLDPQNQPGFLIEDVPYEWENNSGSTKVNLGDDVSVEIPIGFSFPFYQKEYSEVRIGSNGYLTFSDMGNDYYNIPFPSPIEPNSIIAPYWADLVESETGGVYYKTQGNAGKRKLIITWDQYMHWYYSPTDTATFQVILSEFDGSIQFNYQDLDFGDVFFNYGATATVGTESFDGSVGYLYLFADAVMEDEMSILLNPDPPYPEKVITAAQIWNMYE